MTIPARISIGTLGVADVGRSADFYEQLGWGRCSSSMKEIVWFRTADSYLGLFGWTDLAEDANLASPTRGSFGGITMAINVETRDAVDTELDEAVAARGSILKPGTVPVWLRWLLRRSGWPPVGGPLQHGFRVRRGRPDRHPLTSIRQATRRRNQAIGPLRRRAS
jgi:hypothetical protein